MALMGMREFSCETGRLTVAEDALAVRGWINSIVVWLTDTGKSIIGLAGSLSVVRYRSMILNHMIYH
jgi:hypothetical protein